MPNMEDVVKTLFLVWRIYTTNGISIDKMKHTHNRKMPWLVAAQAALVWRFVRMGHIA